MKSVYKLFMNAFFALSIIFIGSNVQAQHKQKHPHGNKKAASHNTAKVAHKNSMSHSIKVIKRTNHVIVNAHKAVKK